jgi:hypothetical protein
MLTIEFDECGHQFDDRPPRSFMAVAEITTWLERLYATCPRCPGLTLDRGALIAD